MAPDQPRALRFHVRGLLWQDGLHLSFTGYEQAVASTVMHGARDVEARYVEALISVYDECRWVADLDVLSALNSDVLKRLHLPTG